MKTSKTAKCAALVALMSLVNAPRAYAEGHSFTPLENLAPELRQYISEQLGALSEDAEIDWDSIVVGINENGLISFRNKEDVKMQVTGGFSCLSKQSTGDSSK